jgi:hypothetical protein
VVPSAGLDAVVKKNSQLPPRFEHQMIQPIAQRYTIELCSMTTQYKLSESSYSKYPHLLSNSTASPICLQLEDESFREEKQMINMGFVQCYYLTDSCFKVSVIRPKYLSRSPAYTTSVSKRHP